jgi:glycyl-tRNA synthetase beta subunit
MMQNQLEDYLAGIYTEQAESQEKDKLAEALDSFSTEQLEALLASDKAPKQTQRTKTAAVAGTQAAPSNFSEDAEFLQKFADAVDFARQMAHQDYMKKVAETTPMAGVRRKNTPGSLETNMVAEKTSSATIPLEAYYAVIQNRIGG